MPTKPIDDRVHRARLIELAESRGYHCTAFVGLPSTNSLYLWAFIDPPEPTLPSAWMTQLDDKLQQRVVDQVKSSPRPCAIRNDPLLNFWMDGKPVPQTPLVRYIESAFVPKREFGGYQPPPIAR